MYTYLCDYPKDREMGWSNECNGVCHDDDNWFFTQNGNLWKFPIGHDLDSKIKSPYPKGVLCHRTSKSHFGDLDYYNNFLYIPVSGKGTIDEKKISSEILKNQVQKKADENIRILEKESKIFVFRADNLNFVRTLRIRNCKGIPFEKLGWLAINPRNGLLYTSESEVNFNSPIHVYSIGPMTDDEPLKLHSTLVLYDEHGRELKLKDMQGGCFDNSNCLHISNGYVTNNCGLDPMKKKLDPFRSGISVFKVQQNPGPSINYAAYRLVHSDQKKGFQFQFDGTGDEPEGITYWDITNDNRVPKDKLRGHLHAIMLNNAGSFDDDVYFKHYRRSDYSEFYKVIVNVGNHDLAGTDDSVFVQLIGSLGTSNQIQLYSPLDDFEKGTRNHFIIEVNSHLGELKRLSIQRGLGKDIARGLFVDNVEVISIDNNKQWIFPCNRWLSPVYDDHQIVRTLTPK